MSRFAWRRLALLVPLVLLLALAIPLTPSLAVHEGDTELAFEPVEGSRSPVGAGTGLVAYAGGTEPESRWTITLRFSGLQADTDYLSLVAGRFGEDGSAEAKAFTPICGFRTDAEGNGGCWYYLVGLRRLGVMQLRLGDGDGEIVLQATRAEGGPGSMTGSPNHHSLPLTATPATARGVPPATPLATPVATP